MYDITKKQRGIGTLSLRAMLRVMLRAMLQRQESWEMLPLWKKREECRSGSERAGIGGLDHQRVMAGVQCRTVTPVVV